VQIQDQLAMAIVAMRRKRGTDQILDDRINRRPVQARTQRPQRRKDQDEDTLFRDEYMWILDEKYVITELETRLDELQKKQLAAMRNGVPNEWSYDKAVAGDEVHEIGSLVQQCTKPEDESFELEAGVVRVISHELSVEPNRGAREDIIEEIQPRKLTLVQKLRRRN
jgi:hypothetical protein